MNVAIIGASDKAERYSYQAFQLLRQHGHEVFPVHQRLKLIEDVEVVASIKDIKQPIDTITLYVAADISSGLANDILLAKPRRIIFNPGAENAALATLATAQGIQCLNACTLVMLRIGQF